MDRLKQLQRTLLMVAAIVIAIRIVLWAITPYVAYIVGFIIVISVLMKLWKDRL